MTVRSKNIINKNIYLSNKTPLAMQYLGGKGRIVNEILEGIKDNFGVLPNFVDLFAGSGVVSYHAQQKGYTVFANDIQPYSSTVLNSLLKYSTTGIDNIIIILKRVKDEQLFSNFRESYFDDYLSEKSFISDMKNGNFNWSNYKNFCEGTTLFSGFKKDEIEIKKHESWNLYLSYYRNTYFGVKQCAEIDYLKELSNQLDKNMQMHLEACVISSMTYCVSSTTHLAQYLKPSSKRNATNLLKRRSLSIIDAVIEKLELLTYLHRPKYGEVLNLDFKIALEKIPLNKSCVIYADPPYFKEHYSRYYHILDTFVLYDYPELTYNKRMQKTTSGRYRENRIVSDFGKKSLVYKAFDDLCDSCVKYGNKLAISYASSSLVSYEYIHELAQSKNLYMKTLEFDLVHSGQGQARHKKVTEYLFLLSNEKF